MSRQLRTACGRLTVEAPLSRLPSDQPGTRHRSGPDGYEHLSWCYCNVPQDQRPEDVPPGKGFMEVCSEILTADPGIHLAVWIQHPHPALVELVAWLKAHHRDRHVMIMQKRGNAAQREFGGRYHAAELALWQAADLRYMSRAGLVAKRAGRLWRDLHFDPRTIPLIHSGLSVEDAEAILGKGEILLHGPAAETAIR